MGKRELNKSTSFTEKNYLKVLGIVLFASLIIKAAAIVFLLYGLKIDPGGAIYDELIDNLIAGRGFVSYPAYPPELYRTPLYPLIGAGIKLVFGGGFLPIIVAQVLMDILTCIVIYTIGLMIFNFKVGIISAAIAGVYPLSVYYASRVINETLFTLQISLILLTFLFIWRKPHLKGPYLLEGIMFGLATLCKPYIMAFVLFLGGAVWLKENLSSKIFLRLVLMVLAMVAVISPWTIRNYLVTGDFVPVATGLGYNMWLGNRVESEGREDHELEGKVLASYREERDRIVNENGGMGNAFFDVRLDRRFIEKAIDNFISQPLPTIKLMLWKPVRLWYDVFHLKNKKYQWIVMLIQIPLILMGFIGLIMCICKGYLVAMPFLLLILYHILIAIFITSTVRYIVPVMPTMILFATYLAVGRDGDRNGHAEQ